MKQYAPVVTLIKGQISHRQVIFILVESKCVVSSTVIQESKKECPVFQVITASWKPEALVMMVLEVVFYSRHTHRNRQSSGSSKVRVQR